MDTSKWSDSARKVHLMWLDFNREMEEFQKSVEEKNNISPWQHISTSIRSVEDRREAVEKGMSELKVKLDRRQDKVIPPMARQGRTGQNTTRQDKTKTRQRQRQDKTRQPQDNHKTTTRQDKTRQDNRPCFMLLHLLSLV
jgi:hypothetical protein